MRSLLRTDARSRFNGSPRGALADIFENAWSDRFTSDPAIVASKIGRARTDIRNLAQAA